jgi:hypothetical protein
VEFSNVARENINFFGASKSTKSIFRFSNFDRGARTESQGGVTVGGYQKKMTESFFMSIPLTFTTMTLPVTACGSV